MSYSDAIEEMKELWGSKLEELVKRQALAIEDLTEKQFADAIRQAIACGDFRRHVCTSQRSQAVIYIPHAREAYLTGRIRELEEQLKSLALANCSTSDPAPHDPKSDCLPEGSSP